MKVVEYGKHNKEVVMFLHGGGLSWWNYQEITEILKEKYHILIPVLDGHFYEYRKQDSFGNKVRNIGFKLNCFKGRMCEYKNQLRQSE